MKASTEFCKIPGPYGYKWPKLEELYKILFNESFNAHNALDDIRATARCFWELKNKNVISPSIFFEKRNHPSVVVKSEQDVFFESNNWDSIQIIVREIESGIEKINHSIERDLIYKYFHLNEYLHKFYESSPVKHWFSITEQLKFDSEGWDMPGNFDWGKYTGKDFNWTKSVNLEIPEHLSDIPEYDMSYELVDSWIMEQQNKLKVSEEWVLLDSKSINDNTMASFYFLSPDKLNKYFDNLSQQEIHKLIQGIINEVSYKTFSILSMGGRWTFVASEMRESIRSTPENYDYYFAIKNSNDIILSTNFRFNEIKILKKEKSFWSD